MHKHYDHLSHDVGLAGRQSDHDKTVVITGAARDRNVTHYNDTSVTNWLGTLTIPDVVGKTFERTVTKYV